MIKCAVCKDYHADIAGVKNCSKAHYAAKAFGGEVPAAPPVVVPFNIYAHRASIREGRYAVVVDGTLGFFKVDRPTEGRWAGKIFVKQYASDELHAVRDLGRKNRIIDAILEDPQAAMLKFGTEIGSCGHCGRTLTNAESRAAGIGPVCRGRMGW